MKGKRDDEMVVGMSWVGDVVLGGTWGVVLKRIGVTRRQFEYARIGVEGFVKVRSKDGGKMWRVGKVGVMRVKGRGGKKDGFKIIR